MSSNTINSTNSSFTKKEETNDFETTKEMSNDKVFLIRFIKAISDETKKYPGPIRHWFRCEFDSNQTSFEKQNLVIKSEMSRENASFIFYIFQALWDLNDSMLCDFLNNYNSNYMITLSDEEFYKKILERHSRMEKYEDEGEDLEYDESFLDWASFYSYFSSKNVEVESLETYRDILEENFCVWRLEDLIPLIEKTPEFWIHCKEHIKEPFSFHEILPMTEIDMKKHFLSLKTKAKKEDKKSMRKISFNDSMAYETLN